MTSMHDTPQPSSYCNVVVELRLAQLSVGVEKGHGLTREHNHAPRQARRLVGTREMGGGGGGGGVRETMRVELTSGGGAFPEVWGSAVSSPIGVWGVAPAALQLLQC